MNILAIIIITVQMTCFEVSRDESRKASWRREVLSKYQIKNGICIGRNMTFEDGGKHCRDTQVKPCHLFRAVQVGLGIG